MADVLIAMDALEQADYLINDVGPRVLAQSGVDPADPGEPPRRDTRPPIHSTGGTSGPASGPSAPPIEVNVPGWPFVALAVILALMYSNKGTRRSR